MAYRADFWPQQAIEAVVRSPGRSLLLVSGGEHAGDEAMLEKARESMEAGATGLIFGYSSSAVLRVGACRSLAVPRWLPRDPVGAGCGVVACAAGTLAGLAAGQSP